MTFQSKALLNYCARQGYQLKKIFLEENFHEGNSLGPQFCALLNETLLWGVKTVIVDRFSSLAINKKIQESILIFLFSKGIAVHSCQGFTGEINKKHISLQNSELIEVQREFSVFDRHHENFKRTHARKLLREIHGKCEGRKSYKEIAPDIIQEILRLRKRRSGRKRRTFKEIAHTLNVSGRATVSGGKFTGNNVSVIVHRLKARPKHKNRIQKEVGND